MDKDDIDDIDYNKYINFLNEQYINFANNLIITENINTYSNPKILLKINSIKNSFIFNDKYQEVKFHKAFTEFNKIIDVFLWSAVTFINRSIIIHGKYIFCSSIFCYAMLEFIRFSCNYKKIIFHVLRESQNINVYLI